VDISFSQGESWQSCRRKWAFRYVDRLIGIPGLSAIRGSRLHKAIEDTLLEGKDYTHIPSVFWAIDSLGEWGDLSGLEPEKYFEVIRGDVKVRGYIDVALPDYGVVLDWKFPGRSPGRIPRENYLRQIQLYALVEEADKAIISYPEYKKAVEVPVDYDKGQDVLEEIFEVAGEIISSGAREVSGFEQEATPNSLCGWCDYRDICDTRIKDVDIKPYLEYIDG